MLPLEDREKIRMPDQLGQQIRFGAVIKLLDQHAGANGSYALRKRTVDYYEAGSFTTFELPLTGHLMCDDATERPTTNDVRQYAKCIH